MSKYIKHRGIKFISVILTLMLLLSALPLSAFQVAAAENNSAVSVKIESFLRGDVGCDTENGIRSSELLAVKVNGTEKDPSSLYYRWTNKLGTYLYVYNSHNMYEVDTKSSVSQRVIDNTTRNNSFTGCGFSYAAIYGADSQFSKLMLNGGFMVEVFDGNPSESDAVYLGSATCGSYDDYSKTVINNPDLSDDLSNAVIGVFEGDKLNIKTLLSEAGIVHLSCDESKVNNDVIKESDIAEVSEAGGEYYISAKKSGVANVDVDISKNMCLFHEYQYNCKASVPVVVLEKPVIETSATTITLYDKLHISEEDSYNYYLIKDNEQIKGTAENGKIVFDNLSPKTNFDILVESEYNNKKVYDWINITTKEMYEAELYINLNKKSANPSEVGLDGLYLHGVYSETDYSLNEESKGYYTAMLGPGLYQVYGSDNKPVNDNLYDIDRISNTITLDYFSVTYSPAGMEATDMPSPLKRIYQAGTIVEIDKAIPKTDGKIFRGWRVNNSGTVLGPDALLATGINMSYTLIAQWANTVDIDVNIEILHGADNILGQAQAVEFSLMGADEDDDSFIRKLDSNSHEGYDLTTEPYTYDDNGEAKIGTKTKYTVKAGESTYKGLYDGYYYGINAQKGNYIIDRIDTEIIDNKYVYTVVFKFVPEYTNISFGVDIGESLTKLKDSGRTDVVPKSANVKVTVFRKALDADSDDDKPEQNETPYWRTIIEQKSSFVHVELDENGKGTGNTSIWPFEGNFPEDENSYQFHFRIKVVSLVYPDGTVAHIEHTDDFDELNNNEHYVDENGVYTVDFKLENGKKPDGPLYNGRTDLEGIYYERDEDGNSVQISTMNAVIDAKLSNVTFDAMGGKINGVDVQTVDSVYKIPLFRYYLPKRDDGYIFRGWYLEKDYKTMAVAGTIISEDTTLYAKWDAPVSVHAKINMDYSYGDYSSVLLLVDRPEYTDLILQYRLTGQGDNAWQKWGNDVKAYFGKDGLSDESVTSNTAEYTFDKLPANDSNGVPYQYRLLILHENFTVAYTPDTQIVDFTDNEAVGEISADLTFNPQYFNLEFCISDDAVIDSVKPRDVKVVYEFKEQNSKNNWETVVQHLNADKTYNPISSTFEASTATGSMQAWKYSNTPEKSFDFRLRVVEYTDFSGKVQKIDYNASDIPFAIELDNIVDSSVVEIGGKATVYAHFVPRHYSVILDSQLDGAYIETEGTLFTDMGKSQLTKDSSGEIYYGNLQYGEELSISKTGKNIYKLPVPECDGKIFVGWHKVIYDPTIPQEEKYHYYISEDIVTEITHNEMFATKYLLAEWSNGVNFHSNIPDKEDEIFRTYTSSPHSKYQLDENNRVSKFDEIPEHSSKLVFTGWYDKDDNPISWDESYNDCADVYAHWQLMGDANKDGKLTINDVTLIQYYLAELAELAELDAEALKACDVNSDGKVDICDVTIIQRMLAELD